MNEETTAKKLQTEAYEKPVVDVILFDYEDVIVTSGCPHVDPCFTDM